MMMERPTLENRFTQNLTPMRADLLTFRFVANANTISNTQCKKRRKIKRNSMKGNSFEQYTLSFIEIETVCVTPIETCLTKATPYTPKEKGTFTLLFQVTYFCFVAKMYVNITFVLVISTVPRCAFILSWNTAQVDATIL